MRITYNFNLQICYAGRENLYNQWVFVPIVLFKLEKSALRILECIAGSGILSTQNGDSREAVTSPAKPLL